MNFILPRLFQYLDMDKFIKQLPVRMDDPKVVNISGERKGMYLKNPKDDVVAIRGVVDGETVEYIFINDELPECACKITYEDMSLAACLEYCFEDEEPMVWRLAEISKEAIEDFKAKKFKLWEHQLKEPECEAAFRRSLQTGPIRNVYDKFIFPTPSQLVQKYKVIDEHSGKTVDLPHQVGEMRIWDPSTDMYLPFDAGLAGAPKDKDSADKYWKKMMEELKELRGTEYIESLVDGK